MEALTVTQFRCNMAKSFDRSDAGEKVVIRRGNKRYAIVPLAEEVQDVSPELHREIQIARQEHKEGKFIRCSTDEELHAFIYGL
ncbi:MAG: hypothetical protein LUI09_04185 [Prevotellaceae bacterium]|nr:hypothetical protein [Prevotellaceae bacterium]